MGLFVGTICRTPYCKILSSSFVKGVFLIVCLHPRVQVLELHVTESCLTWLPATSQCLHAQLLNAQPSLQPSLRSHFSFCAGDWQSLFGSSSLCRGSPETHFQWFLVVPSDSWAPAKSYMHSSLLHYSRRSKSRIRKGNGCGMKSAGKQAPASKKPVLSGYTSCS